MKTVLTTAFNESFSELAKITSPRLDMFIQTHGGSYYRTKISDYENPYWSKIQILIHLLGRYEKVIWMDADQLVTNPNCPLPIINSGVHFSQDWGVDAIGPEHFSACGFVACRDSLPLFEWVESVREQYANGPFPEQTPLRLAYTENRFPGLMHVHSRRVFNAVPIEVHPSVVEPWKPGDFAAHLTNLKVEERVVLARKILERL